MFELIPFERRMNRMAGFDPFREMDELQRHFFSGSAAAAFATDIFDNGSSYLLEAELPGFNKEDISIDIENDCLTISAERKFDSDSSRENLIKRERFYGSYTRSFDVSGINVEGIEAEYTDGVLKLTMPKKQETLPASRKLEIK